MKKYYLVLFCVISLFIITGCGGAKQLVCSKSEVEDGKTMSLEVIFDLDENEKAKDASMVYDFGDTELANTFCEAYKQTTDASKVSCSGTKITIKGIDDSVDETDESEKMIGKTKEEIIAAAKEDGFSCK